LLSLTGAQHLTPSQNFQRSLFFEKIFDGTKFGGVVDVKKSRHLRLLNLPRWFQPPSIPHTFTPMTAESVKVFNAISRYQMRKILYFVDSKSTIF